MVDHATPYTQNTQCWTLRSFKNWACSRLRCGSMQWTHWEAERVEHIVAAHLKNVSSPIRGSSKNTMRMFHCPLVLELMLVNKSTDSFFLHLLMNYLSRLSSLVLIWAWYEVVGGMEREAFDALPIFLESLWQRRTPNWNSRGGWDQRIPREENPCWDEPRTRGRDDKWGVTGGRGPEWPGEERRPCDWRTSASGFILLAAQSRTCIPGEAWGSALTWISIHLHVLNLFLIFGTVGLFDGAVLIHCLSPSRRNK